jgi:hypothetical protein
LLAHFATSIISREFCDRIFRDSGSPSTSISPNETIYLSHSMDTWTIFAMAPKSVSSWRAYIEDGNREFCAYEMSILERFVKRALSKDRGWPDHWVLDRPTAINLWDSYLKKSQTPKQPSERMRSIEKFKVGQAAATLYAARQKLNEQFEKDTEMKAYVRNQRKANQRLKNFDYSKPRAPKAKREGSMRPNPEGRISSKLGGVRKLVSKGSLNPIHSKAMLVDDTLISGRFMANFSAPQQVAGSLRTDSKLGKYIVRKESPLRQSVSRVYISDLEEQIVTFERKNFVLLPRHKLRDAPRSRFTYEEKVRLLRDGR